MWYRQRHFHHGSKWMPFVFGSFFLMFIFWGGWKLFAFLPLLFLIGGAIWFMKGAHHGRWHSEQWRHQWKDQWKSQWKDQWKSQWKQWGDEWEGHHDAQNPHDAAKRKNDDSGERDYDTKRKNDSDIFYV